MPYRNGGRKKPLRKVDEEPESSARPNCASHLHATAPNVLRRSTELNGSQAQASQEPTLTAVASSSRFPSSTTTIVEYVTPDPMLPGGTPIIPEPYGLSQPLQHATYYHEGSIQRPLPQPHVAVNSNNITGDYTINSCPAPGLSNSTDAKLERYFFILLPDDMINNLFYWCIDAERRQQLHASLVMRWSAVRNAHSDAFQAAAMAGIGVFSGWVHEGVRAIKWIEKHGQENTAGPEAHQSVLQGTRIHQESQTQQERDTPNQHGLNGNAQHMPPTWVNHQVQSFIPTQPLHHHIISNLTRMWDSLRPSLYGSVQEPDEDETIAEEQKRRKDEAIIWLVGFKRSLPPEAHGYMMGVVYRLIEEESAVRWPLSLLGLVNC